MMLNNILTSKKFYHKRNCQIIAVHIPNTIVQIRNPTTLTSTNNFLMSLNILVDIFVSKTYNMK